MSSSWSATNLRNEPRACWTGASAQNRAASVCSAVRVVLVLPADLLDLVVVPRPSPAAQVGGTGRPELVGGVQAERLHQAEVRPDRRRPGRDPHAGDRRARRRVGHRRVAEAVVGAQCDELGRHLLARRHAVGLCLAVSDGQPATRRTPVRRSRLPGPGGSAPGWRWAAAATAACGEAPSRCFEFDGEGLVAAFDRHHRVVHGDRHVGEERVPLGRRQRGRGECLRADCIPVGDVGVGRQITPATSPIVARRRLGEADHRDGQQCRPDQTCRASYVFPFMQRVPRPTRVTSARTGLSGVDCGVLITVCTAAGSRRSTGSVGRCDEQQPRLVRTRGSRTRRARAARSFWASAGTSLRTAAKLASLSTYRRQSLTARTVADRGPRSSRASSPKWSPVPSLAATSSPCSTAASPAART